MPFVTGVQAPEPATLLAALESTAMLIYREYGEGPIAPDVRIFTEATPEQVPAVDTVEQYWEAVGYYISHPMAATRRD